MTPAIELHRVSKTYPGKVALDNLSLSVPKGAIFALLGDNGAGKSTTIRILNGLTPPDTGYARILGQDTWRDAAELRQHIGYVPERPKFYDWMTIRQIGWFTSGFQGDGYLDRYLNVIKQFLLDPGAKLSVLSKGQYAKVGLALALAINPEVLILDEPTSGLDLLVRREFLASMVRLAGEGRTILICSHQVAEIERIASHVAFLHAGKVLLTAPLENLRDLLIRIRIRVSHDGARPNGSALGTVLQEQRVGGKWQMILREPNRNALDRLRATPGIHDYEETPLSLEEIYCALFARTALHEERGTKNGELLNS
jgi:ABC-2 type transport system ATP-binding protein